MNRKLLIGLIVGAIFYFLIIGVVCAFFIIAGMGSLFYGVKNSYNRVTPIDNGNDNNTAVKTETTDKKYEFVIYENPGGKSSNPSLYVLDSSTGMIRILDNASNIYDLVDSGSFVKYVVVDGEIYKIVSTIKKTVNKDDSWVDASGTLTVSKYENDQFKVIYTNSKVHSITVIGNNVILDSTNEGFTYHISRGVLNNIFQISNGKVITTSVKKNSADTSLFLSHTFNNRPLYIDDTQVLIEGYTQATSDLYRITLKNGNVEKLLEGNAASNLISYSPKENSLYYFIDSSYYVMKYNLESHSAKMFEFVGNTTPSATSFLGSSSYLYLGTSYSNRRILKDYIKNSYREIPVIDNLVGGDLWEAGENLFVSKLVTHKTTDEDEGLYIFQIKGKSVLPIYYNAAAKNVSIIGVISK